MLMQELLNHIKNFFECPLVSVCASILSIIAAVLTFVQYKNTLAIKEELENKLLNYEKAQLRGSLKSLIKKIIGVSNNSKKLSIGRELKTEVTEIFSDIRSGSIYGDISISDEIKRCEKILNELGEGKEKVNDLKDALCDLSRAIDNSVKE